MIAARIRRWVIGALLCVLSGVLFAFMEDFLGLPWWFNLVACALAGFFIVGPVHERLTKTER